MAAFVLSLPEVEKEGSKTLAFPVTFAWLREALADTDLSAGAGDDDASVGELLVTATKTGTDLLVQGQAQTTLEAPCARCNGPVEVALDAAFTHLLQPMPAAGAPALPDELELTPEDLDRDYFGGDEVALDALVREQLLLELPMRVVHPEGECDPEVVGYLESEAAAAAKVDPRLAPLLALKGALMKDE
ncbi:MAG: DUF177 domain-containing protein [Myxococcota bacterium]